MGPDEEYYKHSINIKYTRNIILRSSENKDQIIVTHFKYIYIENIYYFCSNDRETFVTNMQLQWKVVPKIGHLLKKIKDLNDNIVVIRHLTVICQFVTGVVQWHPRY